MGMGSVLGAGSYMVRTLSRLLPSVFFCATILIAALYAVLQESHSILGAGSVLPAWQRIPTGQVRRALSPHLPFSRPPCDQCELTRARSG